jgi:2-polyprenyl-3-methyl-5-hydroxy-6-metoxy-1,4-benzoquinol methylase
VFSIKSYACSICGSSASRVVMRKAGRNLNHIFDIVACERCAHVYVNPRIADEYLHFLYDEDYYSGKGFDRSVDYVGPASERTLFEVDCAIKAVDAAAGDLHNLRWLDFGCGSGLMLEELLARGANPVGFDDSPAAIRRCNKRGLPLMAKSQMEAAAGSFDVISAVEVIEHVPNPRAFLRYLVSLLKLGGIAYIQTGNWNVVRRLPKTPYIMPEGHIHYFTPPELRRLFFEVGMDCTPTFNYSWFLWRDLPATVRRILPHKAFTVTANVTTAIAPGFGPYPIGIRVL